MSEHSEGSKPPVEAVEEQPSVEKLKKELFVREVPPEYASLIEKKDKFAFGLGTPEIYSEALTNFIEGEHNDAVDKRLWKYGDVLDDKLTPFGKLLKERVASNTFIDLGSSTISYARPYAVTFEAKRYIGVDPFVGENEGAKVQKSTEVYHVADDMLRFIAQLPDETGAIYFLSGIETMDWKDVTTKDYQKAVMGEAARTMKSGDLLIIGAGTDGFNPANAGLQKLMSAEGRNSNEHAVVWIKP